MAKILRASIVLPILAFYLYLAGSAPFLGQWDSFDYLKQICTHQLSALGIGRPVYLGYNIALWESARRIFHLDLLQVETVVMIGTVLLGVLGIVLFQRLADRLLSPETSRMATLALALSPVYAIYSGFVMTEVPMLVLLLAAALVLWRPGDRDRLLCDTAGGALFGLAVGVREQALTMGAAFLWILWCRRAEGFARFRSMIRFCVAAGVVILAPALAFYLHDPAGFFERTRTWLHAIPLGSGQFRNNAEASLLYVFVICPGTWLAVAGAGVYRLFSKRDLERPMRAQPHSIPHPVWGLFCCIVLPVLILWRDADVQMHPRYVLLVLPASLVLGSVLYRRWAPSGKGPVVWAVIQVLVFGLALAAFSPFRQIQTEKMQFARAAKNAINGKGLIIAGNLSPVFDYYRGIGLRPEWQILWSGWNWDDTTVEAAIHNAWADHIPVYLSTHAPGWSYFENELLDLHFLLKDCKKEPIAPHLFLVHPPSWERGR